VQAEQTGEREQTAWSDIDWTTTEAAVRRLQGRIYRAAAAGNRRQVTNLQKFLVRTTSAKRLAVRRLAQQNASRNTAGVDGVVCRTPESRTGLPTGLELTGWTTCNWYTGGAIMRTTCGSGTGRRRLEPDDEQLSRPVLRGPGFGNEARLPDARYWLGITSRCASGCCAST